MTKLRFEILWGDDVWGIECEVNAFFRKLEEDKNRLYKLISCDVKRLESSYNPSEENVWYEAYILYSINEIGV